MNSQKPHCTWIFLSSFGVFVDVYERLRPESNRNLLEIPGELHALVDHHCSTEPEMMRVGAYHITCPLTVLDMK